MQIKNAEELHKLLTKAYQIETQYETLVEWEGYVMVTNPKYRETLFELISESEKHGAMVIALIDMVILPKEYSAPPLHKSTFDFSAKSEFDIMLDLMKYEQLAFDLYSAIREAVLGSDLRGCIRPENMGSFVAILDELIRDESDHKARISTHVGRVTMIK
jgi:hypothetical protein